MQRPAKSFSVRNPLAGQEIIAIDAETIRSHSPNLSQSVHTLVHDCRKKSNGRGNPVPESFELLFNNNKIGVKTSIQDVINMAPNNDSGIISLDLVVDDRPLEVPVVSGDFKDAKRSLTNKANRSIILKRRKKYQKKR